MCWSIPFRLIEVSHGAVSIRVGWRLGYTRYRSLLPSSIRCIVSFEFLRACKGSQPNRSTSAHVPLSRDFQMSKITCRANRDAPTPAADLDLTA